MEVIVSNEKVKTKKRKILKVIYNQRFLFYMSIPFVIWTFIFAYIPIWGWAMAFQEYKPGISIFHQTWVGLQQFKELFQDDRFYNVLRNTLAMSLLNFVTGFTVTIAFALLLNEIKNKFFKRSIQTISYLPHFVSWVIAASLISNLLSIDGGTVNNILMYLHIINTPIAFLGDPNLFWGINTFSSIWKETGWGAIIYLAAISGIDPSLYEAATVDGAGRFKQMWHITLPGIRPTIIVLLILSIGNIINIGFEQQFLLGNNMLLQKSEVLDLYALNYGIAASRYSYGTAIGVFKSAISVVLVFITNTLAKKYGEGGLF